MRKYNRNEKIEPNHLKNDLKNPMTNEHYNIVKDACVKANPEIMELKFGCRIDNNYADFGSIEKVYCVNKDTFESIYSSGSANLSEEHKIDAKYIKILGREIRLADVLYVFGKMYTEIGIYTKNTYYETFGDITARWNLTHDSLEWHRGNKPETLAFLAELLSKK